MCASTSNCRTALELRDTKLKPGMIVVRTDDEGTSLGGLLRAATDGWDCAYRVVGALTSHCVTTLAPPRRSPRASRCARHPPCRPPAPLVTFHNRPDDNHRQSTPFPMPLKPYLTVKSCPTHLKRVKSRDPKSRKKRE
ncbi:unnamed protein product [Pieris brassicae]|uniref:Uncharacterized protein n=1 Tax=Pieris brassicae TaxID=7116 RepID=A0A9P0TJH3_PIEBR|nr:unnamed protein product [Pieris brassicae]